MDTFTVVVIGGFCAAMGAIAGVLIMAGLNARSYDQGVEVGRQQGYEAARSNGQETWHDTRDRLMDSNRRLSELLQTVQERNHQLLRLTTEQERRIGQLEVRR